VNAAGLVRVRVATVNCKRGGWLEAHGRHDLDRVVAMVDGLGAATDILVLAETTGYRLDGDRAAWALTNQLNERLPRGERYQWFLAETGTSRNSPGVWVSSRFPVLAAQVPPVARHPLPPREPHHNTVVVEIGGRPVTIAGVHWSGSRGLPGFQQQAALHHGLADRATILAGDFNTTSSRPVERNPDNWFAHQPPRKWPQKGWRDRDGTWHLITEVLDSMLETGWWDAGERAGNGEPTVSSTADGGSLLRIDRILLSDAADAVLLPDSYQVGPETDLSDHRGVVCDLGLPTRQENR
jgi:endonuclease/exonuclease/phosphatase family metal-dependent hydrolase